MEGSIHCEHCDKVNISPLQENVKIFTQKCTKCNMVSMNKIIKSTKLFACSKCGHVLVSTESGVCDKCNNIDECFYCQMKTRTSITSENGGARLCSVCNRHFHPAKSSLSGKLIIAHPHVDVGPSMCNICNGS